MKLQKFGFYRIREKLNRKKTCIFLILVFILTYLLLSQTNFLTTKCEYYSIDQFNCGCDENRCLLATATNFTSTCGSSATARGPKQSVVTYSIFGESANYFRGISLNAELVRRYYPGWVMRVYYHFEWAEEKIREKLCPLWCDYPHVDFCPVQRLPSPLLDQTTMHPKMWRFLVLGDPLVDRFVSRDLDSLISNRELSAVDEWMKSGKTWHFMRDHNRHRYPIMAGMWGGLNTNLSLTTFLREELTGQGKHEHHARRDQSLLSSILLPIAEANGDYVNHDSYFCQSPSPKKSQPWPVQRNGSLDYVGCASLRYALKLTHQCPIKCRPATHQDWEFC